MTLLRVFSTHWDEKKQVINAALNKEFGMERVGLCDAKFEHRPIHFQLDGL
jgi:hypothetical protein